MKPAAYIFAVRKLIHAMERCSTDQSRNGPLPRRQLHHLRYNRIADQIRALKARLVGHLRDIESDPLTAHPRPQSQRQVVALLSISFVQKESSHYRLARLSFNRTGGSILA